MAATCKYVIDIGSIINLIQAHIFTICVIENICFEAMFEGNP